MPPFDFEDLTKAAFDHIKETLGVDALYIPKTGGQYSIKGIFDNRAREVDPDTEINLSSNVYTLGVKISDLPFKPKKGDKVIIKRTQYQVIDSLEDGVEETSTVLVLHRVGLT